MAWPHLRTSQVPDKVLQHHLPVRLNVGAVHVGVEEDDGEGQDEDGVGVVELLHHLRVAHAVALAVVGEMQGGTMSVPGSSGGDCRGAVPAPRGLWAQGDDCLPRRPVLVPPERTG